MPVLYSKPGCQQCKATERWLDSHGVTYLYVDVTTDDGGLEAVKSLGYTQVPVVEVGGTHWYGFNPLMLAETFA